MKFKIKPRLIYGAILGCAGLLITPAHAGTDAMLNLLKILRDKGTISQDEFEMLRNAAQADEKKEISKRTQPNDETKNERTKHPRVSEHAQPNDLKTRASEQESQKKKVVQTDEDSIKVKVATDHRALAVESADGAFKFELGGRLQIDAGFVDDDQTKLGSGAELRRARLQVKGTMWKVWGYKFQIDFGHGDTEIKDAYIKYKGFKPVSFTLGQQKLPFTLQSWTSNKWIVFQERSLLNTFIEDDSVGRRRFGFKAHTHQVINGHHWTAVAGLFGEGVEHKGPFNESWAPMARLTFAPIAEPTRVLHFGVDAYYRNYEHDPNLSFTAYPEVHSLPSLLNSGVISGAEDVLLLGGEVSTVWGPFHAQGEYLHAHVGRKSGLSDPDFYGWYVQAGYFLTGESRNYEVETAKYERVYPQEVVGKGGWGAWEIAARFSTLDLTDGGILGGMENNVTVALNWYATSSILFRVNYIRAHTSPTSIAAGLGVNENVDILGLRAQVVF